VHRYRSVNDLADDLDRFLTGHAIKARPPSLPRRVAMQAKRRPVATVLATTLLLAFIGFGAGGWVLDRATRRFQSDRNGETISPDELRMLANTNSPLTYTVVPRNTGIRMAIDRDEDGYFDRTEIEFGSDPSNPLFSIGQNPFAPRIAIVSQNTDEFTISWNAVVGKTYRMQFKNSLADPDWTGLQSDLKAKSEPMFKLDSTAGLQRERYYRVLLIE
jgi:hypothetical protein